MNKRAEAIYQQYPRKVGKRSALKSIDNAIVRLFDGELAGVKMTWEQAEEYLISRTRLFANSPAGQKGSYTPYPATFFNRGSYMDSPEEWWAEGVTERDRNNRREASIGVWRPE
jgi:hypothetical protein